MPKSYWECAARLGADLTVTRGHLPSADKLSPSGTSLWKRAQGHLQQAPAMRGRGQLCGPVGCPPGTLKPQIGGPHSVGGAWLKAQAALPLTSQPGVSGVRALTSSLPPVFNPGLGQTEAGVVPGHEMWMVWRDASQQPSCGTAELTRVVSLCVLQDHLRAPRWPCRVPSLAGTGQSFSWGRPVTSTGTVPREKTRASCAVSSGAAPPTPPCAHIPSFPPPPEVGKLEQPPLCPVTLMSSQWQLSKFTQVFKRWS